MHTTLLNEKLARVVARFPIGAPLAGGVVKGPPLNCVDEKVSWLEKFVMVSAATSNESSSSQNSPLSETHRRSSSDANSFNSGINSSRGRKKEKEKKVTIFLIYVYIPCQMNPRRLIVVAPSLCMGLRPPASPMLLRY